MAEALHIIERAFLKIGVKAAETPLTASEIEDGLDTLNDLLSEWNNDGTLKGAVPLANVNDDLDLPRFALGALKANLAMRIAPEYDRVVLPGLLMEATDTLSNLIKSSIDLRTINFPSTLPIGDGNQGQSDNSLIDYFPEDKTRNF